MSNNAHIQLNIYIIIYQTSPTYLDAYCTIHRENSYHLFKIICLC